MKKGWILSAWMVAGLAGPALAQQPADPPPAQPADPVVQACDFCCPDDCCRRGSLLADVGFLILKPFWKTNPAMFIDDAAGTVEQKDFTDATQFVPRIYLGAINANGAGGRIGWWGFATGQTDFIANDGSLDILSAAPQGLGVLEDFGPGMASSYALRMNVWDLEIIQLFDRPLAQFLLSGGIRYAHVSMDYGAIDFFSEQPDQPITIVQSGHNFNGAGPTVALQARRGDNLYLTGTARGSLLFGQGEQTTLHLDNILTEPIAEVAHSSYDMVLPVAELELGLGAKRAVRRGVAFAELGVNAQAWIDAGNASRSQGANDIPVPFVTGNIGDPTLGLFGFYAKAGLTY